MTERSRWNEENLGPTNAKRQHYVPRFYLRPFLGSDGFLRVMDLQVGQEYRTSIENTAVQNHFYDIDIGSGQRASTEDWLAQLEGKAAGIIQRLIVEPESIKGLDLEEELILARFLAALRFRTPGFRKWEEEAMGTMLSQLKEKGKAFLYNQFDRKTADDLWEIWKDKPDHWWMGQKEPDQPAAVATDMLSEVQGFANLLRGVPWRTGRIDGPHRIYTSDQPMSGYLSPVRPWWDGGAFSSLTYYVPLAPDGTS